MRAVVCEKLGQAEDLVLKSDWQAPELGPQDVEIEVKAAALNFPDVLIIQGKYQMQPELPFVPGGECAGVVLAVGSEVDTLKPGDDVISMGVAGAFCERVVVPALTVMPMPKGLDYRQASGIGVTYFTSYYALKQRANIQPGETLLVLGAGGGVGITAVELGKAMGAKVIAAASSEEKLALARDKGADEVINYSERPLKQAIKELTDGRGVDVVYDPVGGDYTEQALRGMAWKGRYLVIGFANGPIPKVPINLTLLKGCSIVGVFWGAFLAHEPEVQMSNVAELWQMFENGSLSPVVTDVYPLEQYARAFNCLANRQARGKVILDMTR
jgi:NADPH2:quinone reductase